MNKPLDEELDMDDDDLEMASEEDRELTDLEKKFKETYDQAVQEIANKEAEATKSLKEAVKLCEKYGVPYNFRISFIYNNYTPSSFEKKFPDLDYDFVGEITEVWDEYPGWAHSAVC